MRMLKLKIKIVVTDIIERYVQGGNAEFIF